MNNQLGMAVHTSNPNTTQEADAGGLPQVQDSLIYIVSSRSTNTV